MYKLLNENRKTLAKTRYYSDACSLARDYQTRTGISRVTIKAETTMAEIAMGVLAAFLVMVVLYDASQGGL